MKTVTAFILGMVAVIIIACTASSNTETTSNETENLYAIVVPYSNYVMLGDDYKAEIYLAKDMPANVQVKNQEGNSYENIDIQNDKISYSSKPELPGYNAFAGDLILKNTEGQEIKLPFESEYQVASGTAAISNKYLIKDIENPLSISVPGVPIDKVEVESDYGPLTFTQGSYIIIPDKTGECKITVKANIGGEFKTMREFTFEVIEKK